MLELVVSAGIMAVVLLIAIQLLAEAGRLLGSSQVEFAQPSIDLATRWLRRDVQGASEVANSTFPATSDPLELRGHTEGTLRYERVGGRLDRVIVATSGVEIGRRTVLRRVSEWEWRMLNAGLVEVRVVYQRRVYSRFAHSGGPPVELQPTTLRRSFALRARPRGYW